MTTPAPATVRASVCMAAYNGSRYIREQIDSILEQLGPDDELVVVDDASTDDTAALVRAIGDERMVLLENAQNVGYVRTFERALMNARGEALFLADQDDVWLPGRHNAMLEALRSHAFVSTSVSVLGEPAHRPRFVLRAADSDRYSANIFAVMVGYRPYHGCAMGFRRDIFAAAVPFPPWLYESHDLWLALVANTHRQNFHLEVSSVARRLHDANQTPLGWRSLRKILRARVMLARCLVAALMSSRRYRAPVPAGASTQAA
jgi:glycosyltransferase involved in cell wall biosynthesis